ncbi:MAG: ATP-binding cassette domain-containing protein, partial [Bdellovibrio sp.]
MAASKQILSVQSLQHSAGGKVLFRDISFGVQESDRVGLIGPNGAGKSTLLRILTGSLAPDSGEVVRRRGLQVACLAQNPEFSETESIYEALSGGAHSTPDSEIASWEWISKLSLDTYSPDTLVKSLSGGWKKRVALGRELVRSPDLLLLDEPTNHLDVQSILWLEDFLQDLPCAVVLVTHDRLFLQRVSKKIFDLDPRNPQGLLKIDGDYLAYREAKELLMAGELQKEWKLANLLRRETDWLRRGAKARQTKQKARQESAAELAEQVQELRQQNHRRKLDLEFGAAEAIPKKLIEARKVSLFRELPEASPLSLFKDLDLT